MTIARRTITLALLFGLFLAPAAQANKIPALKDTPQYQALASYVISLEAKKNTPVSEEQRSQFSSSLTARADLARQRVTLLFESRKNRALNNYRAAVNKVTRSSAKLRDQRLARAQKELNRSLSKARSRFQGQSKKIKSTYRPQLTASRKALKRFTQALTKTRNPRKIAILEEKQNEQRVILQNLNQDQKADQTRVKKAYNRKTGAARSNYQTRSARISKRAANERAAGNREARLNYDVQLAILKDRRKSENTQVKSQQSKGQSAIAAMPPIFV